MRVIDTDSNLLIGIGDLNDVTIDNVVTGQVLTYDGDQWVNSTIPGLGDGEALTRVNDTNVTLTLGGTPDNALLEAVEITVGWSGQLAASRGGTGVSTFGGTNRLLYTSTTDTLASIVTANSSVLLTNGSGVPSWGTTLPSGVQDNITRVGTIVSGVWNGTAISLSSGVSGDLPFANIEQIATSRLLGRTTAGTGDIETISLGTGVEFSGNTLQRSALTGDITASAGSNATTLADSVVTFAKMQNIATDSLLGRDTASTGAVENILLNSTLSMDGSGNLQRAALTGDVTASAGSNATTIAHDAVTFAKMQNVATDSLLGRDTAGSGDVENILLNSTLSMDGSGNLQRAALTGDVTASAGSNATTIATGVVTLAKMADLATSRIVGRTTAGTGVPEALTGAQVGGLITLGDLSDVGTATTTKGNIIVGDGDSFETLAVGTNNFALVADSAQTLGVKWSAITVQLYYGWSTNNSSSDPGTATVKINNAAFVSATQMYISETDGNGLAVTALLASACESTSAVRGQIWLFDRANPQNYVAYDITGALSDQGGWDVIPITHRSNNGSFSNGADLLIELKRTGDKGDTGSTGDTGAQGALGPSAALTFTFNGDTADSDPGLGQIKLNNSTYSSVSTVYIDDAEINGTSVETWLQQFDDSTNTAHRGTIVLKKRTDESKFAIFTVTGGLTDGTGYWKVPVSHVDSNGPLSGEVSLLFLRTGNVGASGAGSGDVTGPGSVTDGNFVLWDGTSGDVIKDGGAFTAATLPFSATGGISSTNVQAAIAELDTEKAALAGATFTGNVSLINSGLRMLDTNASHYLIFAVGSNITADRILTFTTGDNSRSLDISAANVTVSSYGSTLVDDADASTARTTLGLATVASSGSAADLSTGTLPDARLSSAATPYGRMSLPIPASAMRTATTNGPARGTFDGTNLQCDTLDFDTSTQETAYFEIRMPVEWDEGTVTFDLDWMHASTTTNFGVVFELSGVAVSNDDPADASYGTAQTVTDTGGTTTDHYTSPESSAITIAGTPQAGDFVQFRLRRVPANGSDTLAVDARVRGINLYYTTNSGHS